MTTCGLRSVRKFVTSCKLFGLIFFINRVQCFIRRDMVIIVLVKQEKIPCMLSLRKNLTSSQTILGKHGFFKKNLIKFFLNIFLNNL